MSAHDAHDVIRIIRRGALLAMVVVSTMSCGEVVRQGRSPVYLQVDSLTAQRGGLSGPFTNPIASDVITNVTSPAPCAPTSPCPTVFSDPGQVVLQAQLKDVTSLTGPTANNDVTITRYRVTYQRADGRRLEGIDVPYAFQGASTATVRVGSPTTLPFELVRVVAKRETPLVNLVNSADVVTMIAEVTFFGRDMVGREISVSGLVQIDFGNFGDF
jgi:hypothetical protein